MHLARQVYPYNISSLHETYLEDCKDPHTYLLLDLTQSINDLRRFRTNILLGIRARFLHLFRVMSRVQSQLHFLHVLKDAKPQARRALLASEDDEFVKAIVECALNTLNGND